jgi:hypothetical protein
MTARDVTHSMIAIGATCVRSSAFSFCLSSRRYCSKPQSQLWRQQGDRPQLQTFHHSVDGGVATASLSGCGSADVDANAIAAGLWACVYGFCLATQTCMPMGRACWPWAMRRSATAHQPPTPPHGADCVHRPC